MIKSVQITKFGGPEVLKIVEQPSAPLLPHCVRIQVTAAGLNFADLMMRMGMYPEAPKPPFVPGYEVAGKILEVGKNVTQFRPGDRVLAGTRFGGYTTEIVLSAIQVRKTPANLSDAEAASVFVNFLTAWVALEEMGRVRKGDRVLVQSAAGGVGIAAVQIAAQAGAHVVGLVGSSAKFEVVKSLGAAEVLTEQDWEDAQDQDVQGFKIILDSTGGASLKRNFRRLSIGGRIINFGASSIVSGKKRSIPTLLNFVRHTTFFTPFKLMMENKGVFGLNMLQFLEEPKPGSSNAALDALDPLLKRFENGSYKVIVGKTFPLEQAGAAHTYLQSRANVGKVVLTIG